MYQGTLRPPVEGHGKRKDTPMPMRLTNGAYCASSKGQDSFSKGYRVTKIVNRELNIEKIGLIAGGGRFPFLVADAARNRGMRVIAVAHKGETLAELDDKVDEITWVGLGQFGRLIQAFKSRGVARVLMAGTITKPKMFAKVRPDLKGLALMGKLAIQHDDKILRTVATELEREGIMVVSSTAYLPELLAPSGCLTKKRPTNGEGDDIEFGWIVAKELGRLDIGHCVVVRRRIVLAVEAIEGTDKTIQRGGELAKEGAVVVKVSKPNQDLRFDLPAVGVHTITVMASVHAGALAIEAGKTIMFDKEEMIQLADSNRISIISR
jgi:UDP-2,3-diacylglucosamine hydrolase